MRINSDGMYKFKSLHITTCPAGRVIDVAVIAEGKVHRVTSADRRRLDRDAIKAGR